MKRARGQRQVLVALVSLAVAATAVACGGDSDAGDTANGSGGGGEAYSVSLIGDLSGPYGAIVGPGVAGFQTAIKAINDDGGVNGKEITLNDPLDSQSTTNAAQVAVRRAVGEKPTAILMSTASTEVIAVSSVLGGAGITSLIVPNDDAQAVPPKEYYYSTTLSSTDAGNAYVNAIKSDLGDDLTGKKVAIIASNAASALAYGDKVQELVEAAGGSITAFIKNEPTVSSFTSQAGKIMQDPPDAIMQTDSPTNTAVEVAALVDAGYTGPIFGGTAANDDATLQKAAEEGGDYRGPRELKTPVDGDAVTAAAAKYGTADQAKAGIYFSKGWALAYALKAGLEQCGEDCTAATLPAAMAQVDSIEIPGDLTFGAAGFTDESHVLLQEVQFFTWDAASGKAVPSGDPIATSDN